MYMFVYIYIYILPIWLFTSKSRASRLAEVSNYKKFAPIGSQKTSFAYRKCHETPHSFATLFSEFDVVLPHPFSIATTTFQSSQTISALLNFCNSFLRRHGWNYRAVFCAKGVSRITCAWCSCQAKWKWQMQHFSRFVRVILAHEMAHE